MTPSARPLAAAAAVCLSLGACGNMPAEVALPTAREAPTAETLATSREIGLGGGWDRSLTGLRAQDQRVADVAYRIVTANAALCTDLAPQSGLVLQTALEYAPRLRAAAEAAFHLDDRPQVEAVAANSPAAAAGFRTDDILVDIGGQPIAAPTTSRLEGPDARPATYAPVEAAQARIAEALKRGTAQVTVQRGQARLRLDLVGQLGCAYDAQLTPGPRLSASADGRHVFISSALVGYASSDDMLALVLGHEFAHDVLHHHRRLDQAGFARKTLGDLGTTAQSLQLAEKEADYVGLYLTARAGYDIAHAPEFWRRFPDADDDLAWSHPAAADRAASLAATRDEILAKRRSGAPLIPNRPG